MEITNIVRSGKRKDRTASTQSNNDTSIIIRPLLRDFGVLPTVFTSSSSPPIPAGIRLSEALQWISYRAGTSIPQSIPPQIRPVPVNTNAVSSSVSPRVAQPVPFNPFLIQQPQSRSASQSALVTSASTSAASSSPPELASTLRRTPREIVSSHRQQIQGPLVVGSLAALRSSRRAINVDMTVRRTGRPIRAVSRRRASIRMPRREVQFIAQRVSRFRARTRLTDVVERPSQEEVARLKPD